MKESKNARTKVAAARQPAKRAAETHNTKATRAVPRSTEATRSPRKRAVRQESKSSNRAANARPRSRSRTTGVRKTAQYFGEGPSIDRSVGEPIRLEHEDSPWIIYALLGGTVAVVILVIIGAGTVWGWLV